MSEEKNFKTDNVGKIILEKTNDEDFEIAMNLMSIESIRKNNGHHIWVFPVKFKEGDKTIKEYFNWEIEYENGRCVNGDFTKENSYKEAQKQAIEFMNNNPT